MNEGGPAPADRVADAPDFDEFPASSPARWRTAALAALKGGDFEQLRSRVRDVVIEPLYEPADGEPPRALRQKPGPWRIAARIDHADPAAANAQALTDLDGGADALALAFAGGVGAYGCGLRDCDAAAFDAALAGVELDLIALRIDPPGGGLTAAQGLLAHLARRGYAPGALDIDFGCDASMAPAADRAALAALARRLDDDGHVSRLFCADGRRLHALGASEAQELAGALAMAVDALRLMAQAGMPPAAARQKVAFLLAADQDLFLGIAKFRALRRLFARVEDGCGLAPIPARLNAETAWRMMSRLDPYVNVLRASGGVVAAALGGSDTIAALPFTQALGLPDPSARRIARNSQLVLLAEAHLAKVADPAAGSGAIEALTEALCVAAWAQFQAIEREGGVVAALEGRFGQAIAVCAADRERALAERRELMTGVNSFPPASEPEVSVLAAPMAAPPRLAEPFETPGAKDRA